MERVTPARDNSILDRQIYGSRGTAQNIARTVVNAQIGIAVNGTAGYAAIFSAANAVGDSQHVFEDATGVGIGTTSPAALLHVSGVALVCGFALDSGATAGHVLTAVDSSGNAVWSAASGGIDGSGTTNTLPKWSAAETLTDSRVTDDGTDIDVGSDVTITPGLTGAGTSVLVAPGSTTQTGDAFVVSNSGRGRAGYFYRNNSSGSQPLVEIHQDNATDTSNAANIRQDGSGDIINATQNGTERFVVEDGGQTEISATTGATALTVTSEHRVDNNIPHSLLYVESFYTFCAYDTYSSNSGHSPFFLIRKARGSKASPSSVNNGDLLGGFAWRAHNGSSFQQRALILAYCEGVPSGSSLPTRLGFFTGTTSASERMRIDSAGDVGIGTTGPQARLDVETTDNTQPALRVEQNGTGDVVFFKDSAKELMRIESGGSAVLNTGLCLETRVISASVTLGTGDHVVFVDTAAASGNVTITLPAAPDQGQWYWIIDSTNNAGTNNIIIARNGNNINNGAANVTLSANGDDIELISDGTNWWTK